MSVSLMLTEISLQLLGNSFYDILGNQQENIEQLFKSIKYDDYIDRPPQTNDLCQELGIPDLIDGQVDYEKIIDEKFDDVLNVVGLVPDFNTSQKDMTQTELDMQIKHMKEFVKIVYQSNKTAATETNVIVPDQDKVNLLRTYHESERMKIINECFNLLRLMTYIIDSDAFKQNGNNFKIVETLKKLKYLLHEDT